MVWVVTWLSVVVLNVDLGLAIGVVFSMMTVICRTQRYAFRFSPLQGGWRQTFVLEFKQRLASCLSR